MALAGITTLLATSEVPRTNQQGTDVSQIQGRFPKGDTAAFDEELLAVLVPFANSSGTAEALVQPIESAFADPTLELNLANATFNPEPVELDHQPDGSHFVLAFASAVPINHQQRPTQLTQSGIDTPIEPAKVAQLPVPPGLASIDDAGDLVEESVVESSPSVPEESIDSLQPDASEADVAEPLALNQPTPTKSPGKASDSSRLQLSPHQEQTSNKDLTPEDLLEVADQPDAPVASQNFDSATNSTTNPAITAPQTSFANLSDPSADASVVDAPNLAEQIATEAVKHAEVVKQQGQQRFTMRLDPPELGKLVVEMERTDQGLIMRVNAADPVTLGLIQSSLEELNTNLGQQDSVFQEVNIDVTTDGEFQQSLADRSQQHSERKTKQDSSIAPPTITTSDNSQNVDFVA